MIPRIKVAPLSKPAFVTAPPGWSVTLLPAAYSSGVPAGTVALSAIASGSSVPAPAIGASGAGTIAPPALPSTGSVPAPAVTQPGGATIAPPRIPSTSSVPSPSVTAAAGGFIAPAAIGSTASVASPSIAASGVGAIAPAAIPSGASVPFPAVAASGAGSIAPAAIGSTASVPGPTLMPAAVGSATIAGDSIAHGDYASHTAWSQLGYPGSVTLYNMSQSGEQLSQTYARVVSGQLEPAYQTAGPSIVMIESITNDLASNGGSQTAAHMYTDVLTPFVALAKRMGFYVVVCTCLPRAIGAYSWNSAQETERQSYNTMVRGNAAGADGVCDQAANATVGDAANVTGNTTWYADGLHLTTVGQDAIAPTMRAALDVQFGKAVRLKSLATLTLSATINSGTASTGSIIGALYGSTITSNFAGLTVNSGDRTYSYDGTGSAGTVANALTETIANASNSPKSSPITMAAATGPSLNFIRLNNLTGLTETAHSGGGYDYAASGSVGYGGPIASGYSTAVIPAGQDGYFGCFFGSFGAGGPLMGFSTSAAPNNYNDCLTAIYADAANGGAYSILNNGGGAGQVGAPAAGDALRLRRVSDVVYFDVSHDGGSTWTALYSRPGHPYSAIHAFFQTGTAAANGLIGRPFGSTNMA